MTTRSAPNTKPSALDRTLAQTFRAARWAESNGEPVCPTCFEGDALIVDKAPRLAHPGLKSYRCRDCQARFSDLSGTPLRGSTSSLRDWALALLTLGGQPTALQGAGKTARYRAIDLGPSQKRLPVMRLVWAGSQGLREQWTALLRIHEITIDRLAYRRRDA